MANFLRIISYSFVFVFVWHAVLRTYYYYCTPACWWSWSDWDNLAICTSPPPIISHHQYHYCAAPPASFYSCIRHNNATRRHHPDRLESSLAPIASTTLLSEKPLKLCNNACRCCCAINQTRHNSIRRNVVSTRSTLVLSRQGPTSPHSLLTEVSFGFPYWIIFSVRWYS